MIFIVGTSLFLLFIQLALLTTILALCSRNGNKKQLQRQVSRQQRYQPPHCHIMPPSVSERSERSVKIVQPISSKNVANPSISEKSMKNSAMLSDQESMKEQKFASKSSVEGTQESYSAEESTYPHILASSEQLKHVPEFNGKPLKLEPPVLRWKAEGGIQTVSIRNSSQDRHAVKVKCSDNQLYRVNPVYSFIEPGATLDVDILRQRGPAKLDNMVFVTSKADSDDHSPYALFDSNSTNLSMVLPLIAQTA